MRPYDKMLKINIDSAVRDLGEEGAELLMFGRVRPNKEGYYKGWYLQPNSRQRSSRLRSRRRKQQAEGKRQRLLANY